MPAPAMPAATRSAAADYDGRSSRAPLASPVALVAAGLAAFAVALVATLPARAVAPRGTDAVGTVWHGAATLAGGATARWDWSPAQSVGHGAFAADWTVDGPGTLLTGVARLRPFGGTEFAAVAGRAAWPLLAAAVPGLPGCTIPLQVALARVSTAGSDGTVRSLAGTCPGMTAGTVRTIPRLLATFAGTGGRVTTWTDRATTLATLATTARAVSLHVTPAGAALFPVSDIEVAL